MNQMGKMLIVYSIAILSFYNFGCSPNTHENLSQNAEIEIDYNGITEVRSGTIPFLSPQYIFLQTNPEVIIGNITKVVFSGGCFYVFDSHYPAIHVFKETGAYLYSINRQGRGPKEYLTISAFDVNEAGDIFIYDGMGRKIFVFSEMGQNAKEIRLEYSFTEFAITGKDNQILIRNHIEKGALINSFALYNLETKELSPIDIRTPFEKFFNLPDVGYSQIFRSGRWLLFNNRFTGEIYSLEKERPNLTIRISGPYPTEDILENLPEGLGLFSEEKSITILTNIYASDDYITLTLNRGFSLYTMLISRTEKNAVLVNQSNKITTPGSPFLSRIDIVGVYENSFLSVIPQREYISPKWIERVVSSDLDEDTKTKLMMLNETSNHVLVAFRINDSLFE